MKTSFRNFMELVKTPLDHPQALNKWLGIDPEDSERSSTFIPSMVSGRHMYNGMMVVIKDVQKDQDGNITGAVLQPTNDSIENRHSYRDSKEGPVQIKDQNAKSFYVDAETYKKIITPPQQDAMGGLGI